MTRTRSSKKTQPSGADDILPRTRLFAIRNSKIHGRGAFALRTIPKGTQIVEYKGDVITWAEVQRRYPDAEDEAKQNHTFLFEIDEKRVIDATRRRYPAKWINHSCDPNCAAVGDGDRVYIEAKRTIRRGEELAYDYRITLDVRHTPAMKRRYICHCGTRKCRGSLLLPKR